VERLNCEEDIRESVFVRGAKPRTLIARGCYQEHGGAGTLKGGIGQHQKRGVGKQARNGQTPVWGEGNVQV